MLSINALLHRTLHKATFHTSRLFGYGWSKWTSRALHQKQRILILCKGNICRSIYCQRKLSSLTQGTHIQVRSAGFYPEPNRRSPEQFQDLCRKRGIDLSDHHSSVVTFNDFHWSDLIVVMDHENYDHVLAMDSTQRHKMIWLGAFSKNFILEIEDPYDASPRHTQKILDQIDNATEGLYSALRLPTGSLYAS